MNFIKMSLSEDEKCLEIGASRFWGMPDVPEDFSWPHYIETGDSYDLTFLCQINLEDLSRYDKDRKLPRKGILYFFYDLDSMADSLEEPNSCRVIHYNGDLSALKTYENKQDPKVAYAALNINFEKDEDDEDDPQAGAPHKLLGYPIIELEEFFDEVVVDWLTLFQVNSFSGEGFDIEFGDSGILNFYIDEEDLEKQDFSRVRTCILSE